MRVNNKKIPSPGSTAAIKQGCKCAVIDNRYGEGVYTDGNGDKQFWISADCGVHVPQEEKK